MNREELSSGIRVATASVEETEALGEAIAPLLREGDKLLLYGEPGSGKTALTRGLCRGMGFSDYVTSPTFAIVNEYQAKLPVYHFDLYRITPEDLYDIGIEEYLDADGVCVVEWPDGAEDILGYPRIEIRIEKISEDGRRMDLRLWEGDRL